MPARIFVAVDPRHRERHRQACGTFSAVSGLISVEHCGSMPISATRTGHTASAPAAARMRRLLRKKVTVSVACMRRHRRARGAVDALGRSTPARERHWREGGDHLQRSPFTGRFSRRRTARDDQGRLAERLRVLNAAPDISALRRQRGIARRLSRSQSRMTETSRPRAGVRRRRQTRRRHCCAAGDHDDRPRSTSSIAASATAWPALIIMQTGCTELRWSAGRALHLGGVRTSMPILNLSAFSRGNSRDVRRVSTGPTAYD